MTYLFLALVVVALTVAWAYRRRRSPSSTRGLEAGVEQPSDAAPLIEDAQFTVWRPTVVAPAKWHRLFAFAHRATAIEEGEEVPDDPEAEIQRQVEALVGEDFESYKTASEDASQAVPQAGELIFVPKVEGIEFNPPERRFQWVLPIHREEFQFRAGPELEGQTARGSLSVYFGAILIADINLAIEVDSSRATETAQEEASASRPYRKIFASYSHRDTEVVEQFEQYTRTLGDEFLRDVVTLRAGEEWNARLLEMIEEADVFQLFWSSNSIDSKYVRQEYEHALALGRPNFVRPTYWEEPLPSDPERDLPPPKLKRLHFHRLRAALGRASEVPTEQFPTPDLSSADGQAATREFPTPATRSAGRSGRPRRSIGKPMSALAAMLLMAVALPFIWKYSGEPTPPPDAERPPPSQAEPLADTPSSDTMGDTGPLSTEAPVDPPQTTATDTPPAADSPPAVEPPMHDASADRPASVRPWLVVVLLLVVILAILRLRAGRR